MIRGNLYTTRHVLEPEMVSGDDARITDAGVFILMNEDGSIKAAYSPNYWTHMTNIREDAE